MFIYISKEETIINSDQIISARFVPASEPDPGEVGNFSEYLEIFTTQLELEESLAYGGDVRGCASTTVRSIFRGDTAVKLWDALKQPAIQI